MWKPISIVCAILLVGLNTPGFAVELRQVISREHPAIQGTGQGLAVGRDGRVYVYGGYDQGGYVLRLSRDGREKFGATTTYAITGVAVGKEGTFATSNAHFAKSVSVYDKQGKELGKIPGFTGNDEVGWDGPGTLESGASGDFFALDQHAKRIVRVNTAGEIVRSYPLPDPKEFSPHKLWTSGFRVHEGTEQFYFVVGPEIRCHGFDGKRRWSVPAAINGNPWDGYTGGFDVDAEGRLYLNDGQDPKIRIFDKQGQPAGEVTLLPVDRTVDHAHRLSHLRVFEDEFIIRQKSDREIFQVYDRKTGAFKNAVFIDHELLAVTYPTPVWTAGKPQALAIQFDATGRKIEPRLNVWLRPLGTVAFQKLARQGDTVEIPPQASGLYQLRVNAGLNGDRSEYQVESIVEIRPENAIGSLSLFTPQNRRYYTPGEVIPVSLRLRAKTIPNTPNTVEVRLVDAAGKEAFKSSINLPKTVEDLQQVSIPQATTATLPAGDYRVTSTLPGFTIADQYLTLGTPPVTPVTRPFFRIRHGDYTSAFPATTYLNAPEQIARHLDFTATIGENLLVDRMGHGGSGVLGEIPNKLWDPELTARLEGDPLAVAPQKAEFENRVLQTIAGYGTRGIQQQGILLYMDAGLPIGTLFDKRPPEESARDVKTVTGKLSAYPAFRGWSWAANWWIEKRGGEMTTSPSEKTAYEAAMKTAQETGRWDPILETVSDRWIQHAVTAEKLFREAMNQASTHKLMSAMTAPYRQPGIIPPISFAQADEVDLHFQAEQIQWPMISAHNVDFYKRPGRLAWGHPELWNDDGTGGQILSDLMQMVMRGADGVGQSGSTKGFASPDSDIRSTAPGATSIHRRLNTWLAAYGPWLASMENHDPIAIPVSTRMMRLELGWQGVGGFYFTRLFEAYNACLRAHRPVTFVFTEDCQPDTLNKFAAVLVVSQTVELDPPLQKALAVAHQAKIPIYSDQSCNPEVLKDIAPQPLNQSYTKIEKIHHLLNDDGAFWHYRDIILEHAAGLREAWSSTVPAVAKCAHPEVLLTERRLNDVAVLWVVNDAAIPLEQGQLWRVSLAAGSRLPVVTHVDWPTAKDKDVYELLSGQPVDPTKPLVADLRHAPARIFVAYPKSPQAVPLSQRMPVMDKQPANEPFGARIHEVVVGHDQKTALVTLAGWDRNIMLVDLQTGSVTRQGRLGHHFTYGPVATAQGFAVQGYDLNSAEGYHLYLLGTTPSATGLDVQKRFALYGLPKRGTSWCLARQWQEPINNFAISPEGNWIATAGDLGLIVWSRDGHKLWSLDWWKTARERRRLLAAGKDNLLAYDGFTATGYRAQTGERLWTYPLGQTGTLTGAATNADGSVIALRSTANGGRLYILRDGKPVNALTTPADDLALSPDGKFAAVTWKDEVRLYDTAAGLLWSAVADDVVRLPRFSPDGQRIVLGSELGTLYVYEITGKVLLQRDLQALPAATWLADGGLVVGTWLGQLTRFTSDFQPVWTTHPHSDADLSNFDLLAVDQTPTVRNREWGNAAEKPAPLTPNLLSETQALIDARSEPITHGDPQSWEHKVDLLRDGDPSVQPTPWLDWANFSYIDSGWRQKFVVQVDTFRSQIRLKGITFVEDARHPESWIRDTRLQWWDASSEVWRDGPYLLFNGPTQEPETKTVTHTHWFETPVEAAKFRFVTTGGASWPVGNLRWGELVFHGEVLGPSHPDAVANRPVAVLFDEREDVLKSMMAYGDYPFAFRYDDAASGGKSLALTKAGQTAPYWRPPFGHMLPHWDFEIVENPQKSGQYRWVEFSWKAAAPETKGVSLRLASDQGQALAFHAGDPTKFEVTRFISQSVHAPAKWETVRVDLWKLNGEKPFRIRSLSLGAEGAGGLFDRIRLGRTEKDLDEK